MNISILYLFPELMNLYGERGNIMALSTALTEEGYSVNVDRKTLADQIDFLSYDLIYMGAGTERASLMARSSLIPHKDTLRTYYDEGKILLCTGNSMEIFGKTIIDDRDGRCDGIGLLDFTVKRTHQKRYLGDALFRCHDCEIIGFINKCAEIEGITAPLFSVIEGIGNRADDSYEGIHMKGFFGTELIGPLLLRNPDFLRYFIDTIEENTGFHPTGHADLSLAEKSYRAALPCVKAAFAKKRRDR